MTCFQGSSLAFTMEANCGASAGLSDMLVQGWRDTLRIFPAVPQHWPGVAFRDLLTEGAFRVSAVRREGRVTWVRVVAGVDRQLRLRNPFGDAPCVVSGPTPRRQGNDLVVDLAKGQGIVLRLRGEPLSFDEAAKDARQGNLSRIGLR
jgi:hypothetical protein